MKQIVERLNATDAINEDGDVVLVADDPTTMMTNEARIARMHPKTYVEPDVDEPVPTEGLSKQEKSVSIKLPEGVLDILLDAALEENKFRARGYSQDRINEIINKKIRPGYELARLSCDGVDISAAYPEIVTEEALSPVATIDDLEEIAREEKIERIMETRNMSRADAEAHL